MALKLECGYLKGFIGEHEYAAMASQVENAHALLASGKGPGNDFLGWVDLPTNYDKEEFARIKAAAERIKKNTDVFIVIGIGGSYLGARAAIEFLKSEHYNALKKDTPDIYFTGNSISSTALAELVEICEGKDGKGLFPASVVFSTDLHSMGQYIQDGRRSLFETVMLFEKPKREVVIGNDPANVDGLNFLEGKSMAYINRKAFEGTVLAHNDGGVPNVVISAPDFSEDTLGQIIYFFEKACAISGYLLGVNPFNQPGVESYKKNMFALLGKPGYEGEKEALEARLSK